MSGMCCVLYFFIQPCFRQFGNTFLRWHHTFAGPSSKNIGESRKTYRHAQMYHEKHRRIEENIPTCANASRKTSANQGKHTDMRKCITKNIGESRKTSANRGKHTDDRGKHRGKHTDMRTSEKTQPKTSEPHRKHNQKHRNPTENIISGISLNLQTQPSRNSQRESHEAPCVHRLPQELPEGRALAAPRTA